MTRSAVFFRNLNLGQGWAPTRPQLEAVFGAAGASDVVSVLSNGTVLFTAPAPRRTTDAVLAELRGLTGYADLAVVRSASWVRDVAAGLADLDLPEDEVTELVLFDRPTRPLPVPWTGSDGRLRVLAGDRRHAVTAFRRTDGRGSNAAHVVEQLTGVRTTARATRTVLRLSDRIAATRSNRTPGDGGGRG